MTGMSDSVLVYDVGGSHVSAALCRAGDFQLGEVFSEPHAEGVSAEAFLAMLVRLGEAAVGGSRRPIGVALAFPGPFEYENGISRMQHKLASLYGVNLREPLAKFFGVPEASVRFLNDAAAYMLGEAGAGAARNAARMVGFTLGTGIGSGFIVDGKIVTSGKGVPPGGEVWNLPFEGATVEDQISTRAIQADYQRRTGRLVEVKEIASLAGVDVDATATFAAFGGNLGRVVRALVGEFAPEVVVLGGGIARSAELFLPSMLAEVAAMGFEVRIAELQDKAPLAGAGVAWFQQ